MFTGSAAVYPRMARRLLMAFPEVRKALSKLSRAEEIAALLSRSNLTEFEQLCAGTLVSQAHAILWLDLLKVKPDAAIGLSLGESNALFSFGYWKDPGALLDEISEAAMYERHIGGAFETAKQAWGPNVPSDWTNWRLQAPVEQVKQALERHPGVEITIIYTDDDCMIGGPADACKQLCDEFGKQAGVKMNQHLIVHAKAMRPFADTWRRLHTREVLSSPGMRKADFDRLRDQAVEGLAQQRAMAVSVAYRLLPSLVYGSDHPYGAFSTEQTLKRVSVRDCVRMAKELGPKGARLFVSAKTDLETLRTTLESGLGGWKGDAPAPAKPKAAAGKMRRLVFVDMPGSAQSTVIMASTGPERDAADYSATSIMARILGGSFSSRLNMNLREDKGYAYGARGGFSYHREGSHLFASARVRADATADSVQQIFNEVAAVREGPLREEELTRERDGALAALPGDFGTSTTSIGSFRELVFYGLPLDWHAREAERLAALTLDDVEAAGREHLPTDAYLVLVVGDGAQVRDGLREFATTRELAFVEVDVDGKPR